MGSHLVGLHGDGVVVRTIPWVVFTGSSWAIHSVEAAHRRFWCPACGVVSLVRHPGVGVGRVYGVALITALLLLVGSPPLGKGLPDAHAWQRLDQGPLIERRSGRPRFRALRRWASDRRLWHSLDLHSADWRRNINTILAAFAPGGSLLEVMTAASWAFARGALVM